MCQIMIYCCVNLLVKCLRGARGSVSTASMPVENIYSLFSFVLIIIFKFFCNKINKISYGQCVMIQIMKLHSS